MTSRPVAARGRPHDLARDRQAVRELQPGTAERHDAIEIHLHARRIVPPNWLVKFT
jgi:hypothetical protein